MNINNTIIVIYIDRIHHLSFQNYVGVVSY